MKDYKELTGRRFGMLVVKEVLGRERGPNGRLKPAMAVCQCDCGVTKQIKCVSLECNNVRSCGCQRGNTYGKGGRFPRGKVVKHHSCPSPEQGCTYATILKICCHECPRKDECKRWACKNTPDKCGAVYMVAAPEVRDFLTKEGGNINDQKLFKQDRVAHSRACLN